MQLDSGSGHHTGEVQPGGLYTRVRGVCLELAGEVAGREKKPSTTWLDEVKVLHIAKKT
jgi:hypothetical protein